MVRNPEYLKQFEKEWVAGDKLTYERALEILDAMWEEGIALGVLPPKDPLEGIEVDIQIARILNSCLKNY
jgi:hypothetical protein